MILLLVLDELILRPVGQVGVLLPYDFVSAVQGAMLNRSGRPISDTTGSILAHRCAVPFCNTIHSPSDQ